MRSITIKKDELLTPFQIAGMIAAKMYPYPDTMGIEEIITAKQTPVERHDQATETVLDGSTPEAADVFHITTKLNDADRAFVSELAKNFPKLALRSPKRQWDRFKKAWDNSPNKPEWIPVFIDPQDDASERSRVICRQGHYEKIMDNVRSGAYRIVDRNRVPQQSMIFGTYLIAEDVFDYLQKCGLTPVSSEFESKSTGGSSVEAPSTKNKAARTRRDALVLAIEAALKELGDDADAWEVMHLFSVYAEKGLHRMLFVTPKNDDTGEESVASWTRLDGERGEIKLSALKARLSRRKKKIAASQ